MSTLALTGLPIHSSGAMYTGVPLHFRPRQDDRLLAAAALHVPGTHSSGRLVLWVSSSSATARPASAILALPSGVSSMLALCRCRASQRPSCSQVERLSAGVTLMSKCRILACSCRYLNPRATSKAMAWPLQGAAQHTGSDRARHWQASASTPQQQAAVSKAGEGPLCTPVEPQHLLVLGTKQGRAQI